MCAEKLLREVPKKIVEVIYCYIEVLDEWPKMSCADASIHKIKSGYT